MIKKGIQYIRNQKQLHNLSIYGVGQFFNLVTPLFVAPYLIMTCGEANFGKTAVALSFSFFLIVFIDFGVDILGVRAVSIHRNDAQKLQEIFRTTFGLRFSNLFIVMILASLLFWFAPFFNQEKELFYMSLFVVIGQALNPIWFFQGVEYFKQITFINLISKTSFLWAIFMFIKVENDYVYVNLFWGLGMILAHLIALFWMIKKFGFHDLKPRFDAIKMQFKSQFSFFGSQIFVSIQQYAPIVLISYFGSNVMAFQFRVVEQVINVFKTYIVLFFNFMFPRICFLMENESQKAIRTWLTFNGMNFIFILVSMFFITFFSTDIVRYFEVTDVATLADYLKLASLIPVLYAISIPMKQMMLSKNLNKPYIKATLILVTCSTLLLIWAIPFYHLQGVLFVLIGTELLFLILFAYFALQVMGYYQKRNRF